MQQSLTKRVTRYARQYAERRTPWGAPWWVYLISIGAANIARQVLLPDDVTTIVQVSTFAATVLGVAVLVTVAYHLLTRRSRVAACLLLRHRHLRRARVRRGKASSWAAANAAASAAYARTRPR